MRALIAIAALLAGCDQLFQINQITVPDDGRNAGTGDGKPIDATSSTDPMLLGFGQQAYSDTDPYSAVSVSLDGQYEAGTLIVVAVCEASTDPGTSVSDGTAQYTHVLTADGVVASPILSGQLYYSILGTTLQQPKIVVSFAAAVLDPDVRVAAYTNISTFTTFEGASSTSKPAAAAVVASTQVDSTPTLLVAATCAGDQTTGIDGFTIRTITSPNGDALADTVTRTIGVETTTAHQNSMSGLILQVAAFQGVPAR